jgi:hypothetical protein
MAAQLETQILKVLCLGITSFEMLRTTIPGVSVATLKRRLRILGNRGAICDLDGGYHYQLNRFLLYSDPSRNAHLSAACPDRIAALPVSCASLL